MFWSEICLCELNIFFQWAYNNTSFEFSFITVKKQEISNIKWEIALLVNNEELNIDYRVRISIKDVSQG